MHSQNIQLKDLHVSPFNMRAEKREPSLKRMAEIAANIIPTARDPEGQREQSLAAFRALAPR